MDELSARIAKLRKVYGRGLGHRPSAIQSVAMTAAATLQAQSEAALIDPTISINDKVRLAGAARRAYLDMRVALAPPKRKPPSMTEIEAELANV